MSRQRAERRLSCFFSTGTPVASLLYITIIMGACDWLFTRKVKSGIPASPL